MFSAILVLLALPFTDLGAHKGFAFRPLSKFNFWVFVGNFAVFMKLGSCHVESPYIELGQISTSLYFSYLLVLLPVASILENTLIDITTKKTVMNSLTVNKIFK